MSQPPQPPDPQRPEGPQSPHGDGTQPPYGDGSQSAPEQQYGSTAPQFGAGTPATEPQQYSTQQYPSQQGETPRKSGIGKGSICAIIGCVVLVIVLVLGIGGFFVVRALTADEDPQGAESSQEEPAEETATDEATESDPEETTEPEEESTPAEEEPEGSPIGQENALPAGSTVEYQSYGGVDVSVTFGEINWDAEDAVMEANSFNEPAPDGQKYVLVDVAIVNKSEQSFDNYVWAKFDYVDAEGTVYEDAGQVTPATAASEDGPAAPGASTMVQALFLVPEDLPKGGYFVISDFTEPEEGTWVEAV